MFLSFCLYLFSSLCVWHWYGDTQHYPLEVQWIGLVLLSFVSAYKYPLLPFYSLVLIGSYFLLQPEVWSQVQNRFAHQKTEWWPPTMYVDESL